MNLIFTLFWKEFHEHKWKVLSLCAIMISLLLAGTIGYEDDLGIGLIPMLYGYLLIAPTYVAMGVSASEQSNRSIDFIRGLPIATWKAGMVRILTGWVVMLFPLLSSLLLCLLWVSVAPPKELPSTSLGFPWGWSWSTSILVMAGTGVAWCTVLYAWIVAATVNQKTELRAGLIGLVVTVLLIWIGVVNIATANTSDIYRMPMFQQCIISFTPVIWILVLNSFAQMLAFTWLFTMQFCWVVALLSFAISRYGRGSLWNKFLPRREPEGTLPANRILQPPIQSPRAALFWMQYRQTIPIAMAGIALVVLMSTMGVMPRDRLESFAALTPFIGCVLALIIGTGSFVHELEPQLYTFWRSRPISPKQWFWLKFFAGAVVILGCYDLPLFALNRLVQIPRISPIGSLGEPIFSTIVADLFFPILLHMFVYSVAVLAACSVRHPVYAPIFAVCALLAVITGPEVINSIQQHPLVGSISFFKLWRDAGRDYNFLQAAATSAVAFALYGLPTIFAAIFAGWLIRRDISVST